MKIILQKINYCNLSVENEIVSKVNYGLLITIGVHRDDTIDDAKYLAHKVANLRMFKDENDKINLSIKDIKGECLVVSNFSIEAQIQSGTRPNFSRCADFEKANDLYLKFGELLNSEGVEVVKYGKFRHHMHLHTELDGPFTLILHTGKEGE